MKTVKKIGVILLIISVLFLSLGIFVAKHFEKEIINYFIKDLNKYITSEIRINKVDVTFLKKFPSISIQLKNTFIESPKQTRSDTLFYAENIFIQFDVSKLLKEKYVIKSVEIKNGICNLEISSNGVKNYLFWYIPSKKETNLDLELEKVKLNNISISYNNQPKLFNSAFVIQNTVLSGAIKNESWNFNISQNIVVTELKLKKQDFLNQRRKVQTNVSLIGNSKNLKIKEGRISIKKSDYHINGNIVNLKNPSINLMIKGNNIKFNDLLNSFPKTFKETKIKGSGDIDFQMLVKGQFTHKKLPHISGNFNLQNGQVLFRKEKIALNDLTFSGKFDNHNKKTLNNSTLIINDFCYSIENNRSSGKLKIENFHEPKINLTITGKSPAKLMNPVLKNTEIKGIDGYVLYDLIIAGKLKKLKDIKKEEIQNLNIKGKVELNNCNILLNNRLKSIKNINGGFEFDAFTNIKNLSFYINKNDFVVNGTIKNINDYMFLNQKLNADIELFSNLIDITPLIEKTNNNKKPETSTEYKILKLPEKLLLNGNFSVNNFTLGNFEAKRCRGKMKYKPGIITLNAVFFESMSGNINGGGVLVQTPNNEFSIKAQTKLNNINISSMMRSFNNFGQKIINQDQISGILSGNITFSTICKNNLQIDKNSIVLNSYLQINNGRLANFTPLMGLSKFFKSDELTDVQFSEFENSIAIHDKTIYFTDMKINSSVTDLKGSGVHYFNNSYEYKVKIRLSEILSDKTAKPVVTESPFGRIKDDELKKTYIPIKISGVNNNYEVNYDFDETKNNIKTNIQKEKQVLKTIFNEEFKKNVRDSILEIDSTNRKNKKKTFIIEWEEDDN